MKKSVAIILSILIAMTATIPASAITAVVKVKAIRLNRSSLTLYTNQTYQLKVTYSPANTTQKTIICSTSNKAVVKVNMTGRLTALKPGKAKVTITAYTDSNIKASCYVTVKDPVYPQNGLSKTKKVKLKVAFFDSGVGRVWLDYAIKSFRAKFPNVTFAVTASPSIDLKIMPKINAGNNTDMFDLFATTRLTWEQLADNKKIETVDALWSRHPYDNKYKRLKDLVFSAAYRYQVFKRMGHSYTIPFSLDVNGLFYHKQYFQNKGWNQSPKTYAEFTALCDKILASGISPMTFYSGYLWGLMKPKEFELAAENGNTKFNYNFRHYIGKQYTSPEAKEMWTNFYNMGKKKYFHPGAGMISHLISQMQVINHQSAMVVSGSWIQNQMKNSVPSGFTWGFMALPFVSKTTSKLYVQQMPEDSFFVWSGKPSLNKKWSKEFMLWLQNLSVQVQMTKYGLMSVRKDFDDSSSRMASMQGICRDILKKIADKKIIPVDIGAHDVVLKDPMGYGDIAYNLMADNRVAIVTGKKDPLPLLEKAQAYFEKAQATGYK